MNPSPVVRTGEEGLIHLFLEAALDASGDVTTYTRQGGIATLTRGAVGVYTLTLREQYNKFLGIRILFKKATDIAIRYQVTGEDVDGAKTVSILFKNLSSPADNANPVSATIYLEVLVSDVKP